MRKVRLTSAVVFASVSSFLGLSYAVMSYPISQHNTTSVLIISFSVVEPYRKDLGVQRKSNARKF